MQGFPNSVKGCRESHPVGGEIRNFIGGNFFIG